MYDFPSDADGVAIPYGIYDVTRGDGFVVVGTSHNTPAFATNAIHTWWRRVGRALYSAAKELLILADSGSSNGARAHDWKHGLQEVANKTGCVLRWLTILPARPSGILLSIACLVRSASTGQVNRWSTTTRSVSEFGTPEHDPAPAVGSLLIAVRGLPRRNRRPPASSSPSLHPSRFAMATSCLV